MMTSDGIECTVIIKRDGCLLVVYVTEEANRKEISSQLERREAQLGATIIGGNSPSVVRWTPATSTDPSSCPVLQRF